MTHFCDGWQTRHAGEMDRVSLAPLQSKVDCIVHLRKLNDMLDEHSIILKSLCELIFVFIFINTQISSWTQCWFVVKQFYAIFEW